MSYTVLYDSMSLSLVFQVMCLTFFKCNTLFNRQQFSILTVVKAGPATRLCGKSPTITLLFITRTNST